MLLSSSEKTAVIDLRFPGARPNPTITGLGLSEARTHYFLGTVRTKWHRDLSNYGSVRYGELYSGVDLVFYGTEGKLEYDFIVKPGADASKIALAFEGATSTRIAEDGGLIVSTPAGDIRQHAPVIYQNHATGRTVIAGNYVRRSDGSFGFRIGQYDRAEPLIIDPVLTFATYIGGSGLENSSAIATDASGNIYVTGNTGSTNFPVAGGRAATFGGQRDAYVAKYTPAGTLVYAALVGGGDFDLPEAIVADAAGNVAVFGVTASTNFPSVDPIQAQHRGGYIGFDCFLFRLNPSGSELLSSTYIGGNDDEIAGNMAMDREGAIYLTGTTGSPNFAVTPNVYQSALRGNGYNGFVTKISGTGKTIVWSTYLGGTGSDFPHGAAVDALGNVYVSGVTSSRDFPGASTGIQSTFKGGGEFNRDVFVVKLNAVGQALLYGTYIGGSAAETNWDIAVGSDGSAYVTGSTDSTDFPVTPGVIQSVLSGPSDAFVVKINPAGTAFSYSTLFGGNRIDRGEEIAPGADGSVWIVGDTNSANIPMQNALQPTLKGGSDLFVAQLNATGTAVLNSTYFGGDGIEVAGAMSVDGLNITVAGDTDSSNLTVSAPASHQRIYGGGAQDAFLAKINFAAAPAGLTVSPAKLDFSGTSGTAVSSQSLSITAPQGSNINWIAEVATTSGGPWLVANPTRGTGTASISVYPQMTGMQAGTYGGTITITNQASNAKTQVPVSLVVAAPASQVPANGVVNAASFQGGAVSPGEIIVIFGTRIGPNPLVRAALGADTKFPTAVSGVRVLFDNTPAPLIYVSDAQLAAVVPYAIAGATSTQMQVEYQGTKSNAITLSVAAASPGIFTANASGRGQGAILNEDTSYNSAANPARKNSIVVLFATGEGQTAPTGVDGQAANSVFPKPMLPVTVRIGGVEAEVLYAGAAPGLVAGMLQINARVPEGAPAGNEVPVTKWEHIRALQE